MAIKIKNREKGPEETPEEEAVLPEQGIGGGGLDGFERTAFMATSWVEENRKLIFGGLIALVVIVVATLIGLQYVRGQQVEASNRLSAGLNQYQVPVEGSPELEMIRERDEIPEPPQVFASEDAKWEAIHSEAENTLREFDRGPVAASARFTKAAAALNLGRGEEAAGLYREVLASTDATAEVRSFAQMGLAKSLSVQGDISGAKAAWESFGAENPTQASYADFEVARLVEREGNAEEARKLYEAFLQAHPTSDFRGEVERRLALM